MFADGLHIGSEQFDLVDGAECVEVWVAIEFALFEEAKPVAEVSALFVVSVGGDCVESGV